MMSNSNLQVSQSAGSSGNMCGRVEIAPPKICWCGDSVVELKSKSNRNPGRMYYRCSYAANNRLMNDGHIFKWANELSGVKAKTLEDEVVEMKQLITDSIEFERKKLDQMEIEVEENLNERIEVAILDAKRGISKALEDEVVEMKQMIAESVEFERKKLKQMEIEVEERLTERIEVAILEAKRRIWKALGIVFIAGLAIMFGFAKLFG